MIWSFDEVNSSQSYFWPEKCFDEDFVVWKTIFSWFRDFWNCQYSSSSSHGQNTWLLRRKTTFPQETSYKRLRNKVPRNNKNMFSTVEFFCISENETKLINTTTSLQYFWAFEPVLWSNSRKAIFRIIQLLIAFSLSFWRWLLRSLKHLTMGAEMNLTLLCK